MSAVAEAVVSSAPKGTAAVVPNGGGQARPRSLWPREHGAYAQLGLPLLVAVGAGHAGPAAWLMVMAAVAAFFAHEPLLVSLGQRGARARAQEGAQARVRLGWLAAGGATLGVAGSLLAPPVVWLVSVIPLAAAAGLGALATRHREKTLPAEIVAALALSSAALPVALASGWSFSAAVAACVGWAAGFSAITGAVWPIAHKRQLPLPHRVASVLFPASAAGVATFVLGPLAAMVSLPLILAAAPVVALRPSPLQLRRVGWAVAAASATAALVVVIVGLVCPRLLS